MKVLILKHIYLACAKWPMIHPQYDKYGKPVRLWYKNLYEPQIVNNFILVSSVSARVIYNTERLHAW